MNISKPTIEKEVNCSDSDEEVDELINKYMKEEEIESSCLDSAVRLKQQSPNLYDIDIDLNRLTKLEKMCQDSNDKASPTSGITFL
jgi:hypothetical protein